MLTSVLKAHLHTSRKIVNDSQTFVLGDDLPDLFCDCCLLCTFCVYVTASVRHPWAWVAISNHGIIGPFWFDDEHEQPQTVNTERYVAVLRKFWASLGRRRGMYRDQQWFQQDGATPLTSNVSLAWLRERFDDRLISRRCDVEWAPHSPYLNPPYFFICGNNDKDNVYENNP